MLLKTFRGVLIETNERTFPDGGGGTFCSILLADGSIQNFWCPRELSHRVNRVHDVEGYDDLHAENWKLRGKGWENKTKWTLVD